MSEPQLKDIFNTQGDLAQRLQTRLIKRVDKFVDVKLPNLPEIPCMITKAEKRYLYWLIAETYTGSGAIVELGPWLGASTTHLAVGLKASKIS